MIRSIMFALPLMLGVVSMGAMAAQAQEEAAEEETPVCRATETARALDFWVGTWEVTVDGQTIGHNRIERTLDGCAIFEHWEDARGGMGKSLFYFDARADTWNQVWVTPNTARPGGLKEKALVERMADGTLRFQAELARPDGNGTYLDRTTLIPMDWNLVKQIIEISTDGGETWQTGFEADYVPVIPDTDGQ